MKRRKKIDLCNVLAQNITMNGVPNPHEGLEESLQETNLYDLMFIESYLPQVMQFVSDGSYESAIELIQQYRDRFDDTPPAVALLWRASATGVRETLHCFPAIPLP